MINALFEASCLLFCLYLMLMLLQEYNSMLTHLMQLVLCFHVQLSILAKPHP